MTRKTKWRAVGVFDSFGNLVGVAKSAHDAWFYVENDYLGSLGKSVWKKRGFTERKVWIVLDAPKERNLNERMDT